MLTVTIAMPFHSRLSKKSCHVVRLHRLDAAITAHQLSWCMVRQTTSSPGSSLAEPMNAWLTAEFQRSWHWLTGHHMYVTCRAISSPQGGKWCCEVTNFLLRRYSSSKSRCRLDLFGMFRRRISVERNRSYDLRKHCRAENHTMSAKEFSRDRQ